MAVLIVGATRGLGAALAEQYAEQGKVVYATARDQKPPLSQKSPDNVQWITGIDLTDDRVGSKIASALSGKDKIDTLIITAGYFGKEEFESKDSPPDWEKEVRMYTTSSVAPVFIVSELVKADVFVSPKTGTYPRIVLVSSESGSITLRHETEGGGNYGHHASKAALNMVGKLLSLDLKSRDIIVSIVHPGFMRTEMTRGVGFDQFWDSGGAVTPDEAAKSLIKWTRDLELKHSGQLWAPRGSGDIGTAPHVLGDNIPEGPLQLPW